MSASRERKQRKQLQGDGPSQKALKAQQEQAARKRKTIIYSAVAVVAAVLVAALLIWRSGFFQGRASAATVGGETLSTAQLSYYYHSVRNSYLGYASYIGFDTSKADDEQLAISGEEGQTYRDLFMDTALLNAQRTFALAKEAENSGHTKADIKDDLNLATSNAKSAAASSGYSYAAYLRLLYGPYMSVSVFEQELTRVLMSELVEHEKEHALSDSFTQNDMDDYYKEHGDDLDTIEYSYLYFAATSVDTKDDEGNELSEDDVQKLKDEAKAQAKEKAEEALEAVKGGSSFTSQIEKYNLNATSAADHAKVVGTGSIGTTYRDQLLKLGKDKCDLVESDNGYYVISFHDRYLEDAPTRDVRHILALAETTTDVNGNTVVTEEAWAAAKEKIDAIQAEWESGDRTEDSFAALANEKSDDGDGTTGGLYTKVGPSDGFVPEFADWVFADGRKAGDTGVVQHIAGDNDYNKYWGYHFIYLVGDNEPVWQRTTRGALTETALTEWTEGLTANYPTALTGGANHLGK